MLLYPCKTSCKKLRELVTPVLAACKALVNQNSDRIAAARAAFVDLKLDDNAEQP